MVYFDVARAELVRRLTGRRVCRQCGTAFHLVSAPPRRAGRLRSVRGRALPARGRQRGDGAPAARRVSSGRPRRCSTTTASAACWPTVRGEGADRRTSAADIRKRAGGRCRDDRAQVGARARAHAAGRAHPGRGDGPPAGRWSSRACPRWRSTRTSRRFIRRARAPARLQGLSRLSGHRVHLDQRGGRARDPLGASAGSRRATSSGSTSGVSWKGTTPTARSRCAIGRGAAAGAGAARRDPGEPRQGIAQCRAGQPARRRLARRPVARREPRLLGRARLRRPRHRPGAARGAAGAELRRAGPGAAAASRAWCWRIEPMVTMGELGGPHPGRRLDGGDRGRQPGRPLRAHDRDHRDGARGAHRQEWRRRRRGGLRAQGCRKKTRSRSRERWWSRCRTRCSASSWRTATGCWRTSRGKMRMNFIRILPGRQGEGRAVALRPDARPDHLPVQVAEEEP